MTRYIYTLISLFAFSQVFAQIDTTEAMATDSLSSTTLDSLKKIEVDEVQVIKSFEVKLGEAKRIGIGPTVKKIVPQKNTYDYDVTIVPATLEYADPIIKPLAMNPDAKVDVDHIYGKLGYGNIKSPYADLSYFRHVPELYEFTISGHHYGLDNSNKLVYQKFDESSVDVSGKYLLGENLLLSADLNGALENRNLNNANQGTPAESSQQRSYNLYGILLGAASAETTENGLNYRANLGLNYQSINTAPDDIINFKQEELDFAPSGYVSQQITDHFNLSLGVNAYITKIDIDDLFENYTTLEANPIINFNKGILSLSAGADLVNDDSGFSPFVDIELGVDVTNGIQVYAGADQEIMRNNLSTSKERNPYVQHDVTDIRNSIIKRIYGGLRGRVLSKVTFNLSGGYEDIADHYYYDYDGVQNPTFSLAYTDVKNIAIDANINFQVTNSTQVGGVISHNFFDISDLESFYNIPSYRYEAYTKVGLLSDKLQIRGSLALAEAITYLNQDDENTSGNALTDLSAEIDYFITPNIAIWARGNNLLDNKYEQLEAYQTIGLNLLGGVLFKF